MDQWDVNGNGSYLDVGDEELSAYNFNTANEWTTRTVLLGTGGGTSTLSLTPTYDAVGNLIDDGEDFEYVYDPFGRLRFVKRTDIQAVVAEYRYNGLGFRVGWHYDVDADGTVENTSDDPWFFFAYDEGWRMVATYRSTDSSPKEQFVYHAAGLGGYGGYGGSSYIDAVILRDRDDNSGWASAADGTLEERLYYVQNWRADVVAIVTSAGKLVERVRYSAYGIPTAFPAGDTDCDGDWDATDAADIGSNYTPGSAYAVRRDTDLDGDVDAADVTHASSITGGFQTLGRDVLTSAAVRSRIGYAGYQYDPTFAGVDRHLSHVRHRVYDAELGRWTRRDPLGHVDGASLYQYATSSPLANIDPSGLYTNWFFFMWYFIGQGQTINLVDVGLLDPYISHPAVARVRYRVNARVHALGEESGRALASSMNCDCGQAPQNGTTTATIKGVEPIKRSDFVLVWPNPRDPADPTFLNDWTFSIGGHRLQWNSACVAWAWCDSASQSAKFRYWCPILFHMRDYYSNLLSLPGHGWDPKAARPYFIEAYWVELASGSGAVPKSFLPCGGNE